MTSAVDRRRQSPDPDYVGAVSYGDRDTAAVGRLTPRELDVMRCLAEGKGAGEAAAALGIAENTIRTHKQRIRQRLGVTNTIEAMRALGWVVVQ